MRKGDMRREELIATAERLFYTKGYEKTSVQDILTEMNFSKGGFYHHFESKLQLLDALLILQTRGLSCGSERNEEVDSGSDLTVGKGSERLIIHLTVPERGDQSGSAACKIYLVHNQS